MPSLTRTFQIPTLSTNPGAPETVDITIHEPSLTGDNLGHKTWAASYLLAKRLPKYISSNNAFQASCRWSTYVRPVQPTTVLDRYSDFNYEERVEAMKEWEARGSPAASSPWGDLRPRVLELGAGTGLVGLAASALFSMKFHLTDLDSIIPNLQHNVQENVSLAERSQSAVTVGVLDWSSEHPKLSKQDRYRFVLAADSLYAPQHAEWLANTMNAYLEHAGSARIFVELPIRTADSLEHVQFKSEMFSHSFRIEEEGEEVGYDDWEGSTQDDRVEVKCWWSVWYRQLNLDSPASDQKAPGGQLTAREKAI